MNIRQRSVLVARHAVLPLILIAAITAALILGGDAAPLVIPIATTVLAGYVIYYAWRFGWPSALVWALTVGVALSLAFWLTSPLLPAPAAATSNPAEFDLDAGLRSESIQVAGVEPGDEAVALVVQRVREETGVVTLTQRFEVVFLGGHGVRIERGDRDERALSFATALERAVRIYLLSKPDG